MSTYNVKNTSGTRTISIQQKQVNDSSSDVTLVGNSTVGWGEYFNQNYYRLTENFAVHEKSAFPGTPQNEDDLGSGQGVNNPITGQLWYNISQQTLFLYNGTNWKGLPSISDSDLGDLANVDSNLSSIASNGDVLTFSNGEWIAAPPSGGGGGGSLNDLTDVTIIGTPQTGQTLQYEASQSAFILGDPVTQLDGLSNVNVGGAIAGNVLEFDGGNWVPGGGGGGVTGKAVLGIDEISNPAISPGTGGFTSSSYQPVLSLTYSKIGDSTTSDLYIWTMITVAGDYQSGTSVGGDGQAYSGIGINNNSAVAEGTTHSWFVANINSEIMYGQPIKMNSNQMVGHQTVMAKVEGLDIGPQTINLLLKRYGYAALRYAATSIRVMEIQR